MYRESDTDVVARPLGRRDATPSLTGRSLTSVPPSSAPSAERASTATVAFYTQQSPVIDSLLASLDRLLLVLPVKGVSIAAAVCGGQRGGQIFFFGGGRIPDDIPYQLRNRSHNMTLINKTKFLNNADYIVRIIYKYSY